MVDKDGKKEIREKIIDVLRNLYDPEIPINLYDLGLIYRIDVKEDKIIEIDMTLTTPGCPIAFSIVAMVEGGVREAVGEDYSIRVNLVWDPPWTPAKVSSEGRALLKEMFGYDVVEEWIKKESEMNE